MDRILINTSAELSVTFYEGETGTSADGTVSLTILGEDGSTVVSATNATPAGTASPGVYTYTLAPRSELDVLTAHWTGEFGGTEESLETQVEIVGSHIASLSQIRAQDSLNNETKFPTAVLEMARNEATSLFESYCGRSFILRYGRYVCDGNGTTQLILPHGDVQRLIGVTQDATTVTPSTLKLARFGRITKATAFAVGTDNVVVRYVYGTSVVPADIRRAFLTYVRYLLLDAYNRLPDRTLSYNADGMLVQLAQAGTHRPTGLPEVDAVLYRHRVPSTAIVGGL